jgi:DeoR family transcriptional regulator of aga operon
MDELAESPPAAARREQIREIIRRHGFVRVSQLSEQFGISGVTIRADLDELAKTESIQRVHGGAVSVDVRAASELAFEHSMLTATGEKRSIGVAAAALVESGQAIILDVGTTTTAIAEALVARTELTDVVVITNALNIAVMLEPVIPRFTVIVTGGTLRSLQHSLVDPSMGPAFDHVRADIAFIGCSGIDSVSGITNVNLPEADIKRRMIETANRTVVVADSSKLGRRYLSRVGALAAVDLLVTGEDADPEAVTSLEEAGLAVQLAPLNTENEGS